jgi:hypothetical protein
MSGSGFTQFIPLILVIVVLVFIVFIIKKSFAKKGSVGKGLARLYFAINFIVSLFLANYYFVQNALLKTCYSASIPSKCKSSFLSLIETGRYGFLENNIFESRFWTYFVIAFVALTIFYWILKWVVKGFKKNK